MTTREKFGSFVAAIRCPNKECHDKGFTMYPENMEDNILPCLCHGCGKMFYVEIDQEESLEEELEKKKIENRSEESDDILDEEKPVRKRRVSKERTEKDTQRERSERRREERNERQESDQSHQKHRSFLTNFEDDDEIYDEEDDFDFVQYQKRLQKRQNKKKQETVRRRRERVEKPFEEDDLQKYEDMTATKQFDSQEDESKSDWEEFSFIKKQKKYMSPERKLEQPSFKEAEEDIKKDSFDDDISAESDIFERTENKRTEKTEKRNSKRKTERKAVFDEDSELDREFEAMLDDDSDEWFFGDEKKSDFGKFKSIFQRKSHK